MPGDEKDRQYELEPHDEGAAPSADAQRGSVHDLDVCPNCGASMRDMNSVVCTRCGFDQKTLRFIKTDTREKAVEEEAEEEVEAEPPLTQPGRGDSWLPASIAVASLLVLVVAALAGGGGLFHGDFLGEPGISGFRRFTAALQIIASAAVWSGLGFIAVFVTAHIEGRRLGDWRLAFTRMAGIVSAMMLVMLFDFGETRIQLELAVELILQAAAFAGLTFALFYVPVRSALLVTGAFAILHVLLLAAAPLLGWIYSAA